MKINKLTIQNFKGFEHKEFTFDPHFNVLIGDNGAGKTTTLDTLVFVLSIYFKDLDVEVIDKKRKNINKQRDVRRVDTFPCRDILVEGEIIFQDKIYRCGQSLKTIKNNIENIDKDGLAKVAEGQYEIIKSKEVSGLPIITYYGIGRLFGKKPVIGLAPEDAENSIFEKGYFKCLDTTRQTKETYLEWFKAYEYKVARSEKHKNLKGRKPVNPELLEVVREAITSIIPAWQSVFFDTDFNDLMGEIQVGDKTELRAFKHLSDGQKNMVGLVAELAYRCVTLNPHLGRDAVKKSQGIVLIDEIDLHLHPKWQRSIVADLKKIFPSIQFIVTTHSPFIVQSLKAEELINLDKQVDGSPEKQGLDYITENFMGVTNADRSIKYQKMLETSERYFKLLEKAEHTQHKEEIQNLKKQLDDLIVPFYEDVAFVSFLQIKKLAKLGE
jgi:predicted ATP-binding protein involved in virulence